ncbi:hypothetical protein [Marispirochaeta aestuarii]|uniref:hypothetical protein n=1 Tax=Marispirochaeta aestuarii TaxID=1963862 RepID=UPI0029C83418|nr:hypothetical protein [Marispirochaeta aestuarii]
MIAKKGNNDKCGMQRGSTQRSGSHAELAEERRGERAQRREGAELLWDAGWWLAIKKTRRCAGLESFA